MQAFFYSLRSCATAVCLLALVSLAHAQWAWKGTDGRMVFSDQPPPAGVADKDITRRPAGSRAPSATTTAPAADSAGSSSLATPTSVTATTPKPSGKDPELEKRRKEAESKEAAAKKAEAEKFAAVKRDNCERAKRAKASVDSGVRVSTTNAKGEREIMSEAQRAEESKRLQGIIASDCS